MLLTQRRPPLLEASIADLPRLFCGCRLACIGLGILAAETLDPARSIDQLLLTGEEWVAGGTNFYVDIALVRGPRFKVRTTSTLHPDLFIAWMYSLFWHLKNLPASPRHRARIFILS
jgi:hypothetical protein